MSIPPYENDDPWQLRPAEAVAQQPQQPALQVGTIEGIEPLDIQLGVFPKKTVPDALHDAMFGQPDPSRAEIEAAGGDPAAVPPMHTYAILDAAKVTNLPELLENSGLEHRCLFKGEAYDELRDVAPWIVQLEDGNHFTRSLFTRSDAPWHLRDTELGIYIRSRDTLEEIWRHFRKFARVKMPEKGWIFFRYYDPSVLDAIIESRESLHHGCFGFMRPFHSIVYRNEKSEENLTVCLLNGQKCDVPVNPDGLLVAILDVLKVKKIGKDATKLAADIDPANIEAAFQAIIRWLNIGFDNLNQLRTIVERDRDMGYRLCEHRRVHDIVKQHGASYDAYLKIKRLNHE